MPNFKVVHFIHNVRPSCITHVQSLKFCPLFLPLNLSSSPLYVGPTHTFCEQFFLQAHAFLPAIRVINRFMSHRQQNERNTACTKKYVESSYEQSANDAFIHPRIFIPYFTNPHIYRFFQANILTHIVCVCVYSICRERERERDMRYLFTIPSHRNEFVILLLQNVKHYTSNSRGNTRCARTIYC